MGSPILPALVAVAEPSLGGTIAALLRAEVGLDVESVDSAGVALHRSENDGYGLVVLDDDLPDLPGSEVARTVSRWAPATPVVVLASRPSEAAEILALQAGAIDYVAKSAPLPVIMARLRAHLRHAVRAASVRWPVGDKIFVPDRKVLVDPETEAETPLTNKESRLLRELLAAHGETVPMEDLLAALWDEPEQASRHAVHQYVYRLRRKLGRGPRATELVRVGQRGYRLVVREGV